MGHTIAETRLFHGEHTAILRSKFWNNKGKYERVDRFDSVSTYLPLLDHGAQLVTGQVHAMEVGQHIAALHLLSNQFELAKGHFIVLEISQRDLKHSAFQSIRSNFWREINNNNNKYISRVFNPSVSNLTEAQSTVHVQLKPSKLHIQLNPSQQRNQQCQKTNKQKPGKTR